jgi:peroxiredoxin
MASEYINILGISDVKPDQNPEKLKKSIMKFTLWNDVERETAVCYCLLIKKANKKRIRQGSVGVREL